MASWSQPLQLLYRDDINSQLVLNKDAVDLISAIHKNLVVICVVGAYRTGKSYLLNRISKLMGNKMEVGFDVSASSEAQTKGIRVMYLDHPSDNSKGLLLLDTEGLGDPQGGGETFDYRILCLSILLCSCFVYNHSGEIDLNAIDKLKLGSHVTSKISLNNSKGSITDLASCFPVFTFVVRNFQSELSIKNSPVTENEYMEHKVFSLRKEQDEKKACLTFTFRNCFLRRNCFTMSYPATKNVIKRLNTADDDELDEDFVDEFNKFYDYVISGAPTKVVNQVDCLNGQRLALLTENYVKQVNAVEKFTVEEAVGGVAKEENEMAVISSIQEYNSTMHDLKLAGAPLYDILKAHVECSKKAAQSFIDKCMEAEANNYFQLFQHHLRQSYIGNLQHFLVSEMSAPPRFDADENEVLEAMRPKIINKFVDLKKQNLVSVEEIFKLLDQIVVHKDEYRKSVEEHIVMFNEWTQERQRIRAEKDAELKRLKERELERLRKEGYENSEFYVQVAKDIAVWGGYALAAAACIPLASAGTIGVVAGGAYALTKLLQKSFWQ